MPEKQRLWVLPWGLYPRRVTIYLEEKGILDKLDVVPVNITTQGMDQPPGKPAGSMPILEVKRPSSEGAEDGVYIVQSVALLEYLEDQYGPGSGTPDMRGSTPEERAKVRDCMSVICEATDFFGFYCHNASKLFSTMEEQSEGAAKQALARTHHMLSSLEKMADAKGPWLASSGDHPMLVDCIAMSTMQFAEAVYKVDLTEDHPRLKKLFDAFSARESAKMEEVPDFVQAMAPEMSVR
ncbi:uncharacterized protein LTR77_001924 [Saxophila tyrrhenica]|uniref:Uncharacterized protein n=1 Tax=Saxophila tyrrhenica TaxID=1690608 RepID=A0AAV9PLR1_9PEZI|nr:hypothetical protein LTR77_001924 [Saxophila tyrrhenica]